MADKIVKAWAVVGPKGILIHPPTGVALIFLTEQGIKSQLDLMDDERVVPVEIHVKGE